MFASKIDVELMVFGLKTFGLWLMFLHFMVVHVFLHVMVVHVFLHVMVVHVFLHVMVVHLFLHVMAGSCLLTCHGGSCLLTCHGGLCVLNHGGSYGSCIVFSISRKYGYLFGNFGSSCLCKFGNLIWSWPQYICELAGNHVF